MMMMMMMVYRLVLINRSCLAENLQNNLSFLLNKICLHITGEGLSSVCQNVMVYFHQIK